MTKLDKLRRRLLDKPKDFSWDELVSVMESFGYALEKSRGSGRKFLHPDGRKTLFIHQPHPSSVLKAYQVRDAIDLLTKEGLL